MKCQAAGKLLVMAVGCLFATSAFAEGEYVTLLKSDDMNVQMSSFLTNTLTAGYGWSSGGQYLDANMDYLVDDKKKLVTPWGRGTGNYVFPGRSLILDGAATLSNRSTDSTGGRPVVINDLIVKNGYLSNDGWCNENIWDGQITFDGTVGNNSYYLQFRTHLSKTYIRAKLIGPAYNSVGYWSNGAGNILSSGAYSWKYYLEGDCSEYMVTNDLAWGAAVFVDTTVVPGAFKLSNASKLSFGTKGVSALTGSVVGRDAYFEVSANKQATVSSVDFAWATPESHVSTKNVDYYTGETAVTPYVNVHKLTKRDYYLNRISVADKATLGIEKATLDDTEIVLGRWATLTVGDLTMNGGILEAAGTLAITNSLTVTQPIAVRLASRGCRRSRSSRCRPTKARSRLTTSISRHSMAGTAIA